MTIKIIMDQYWTELFEGLRQAGIGLQHTINGLEQAAHAARTAHEEHGDLRESIRRLEALVPQVKAGMVKLKIYANEGYPLTCREAGDLAEALTVVVRVVEPALPGA